MTLTNAALIAVAAVAILGAVGAFAVAFRRSQTAEKPDPMRGVSGETLAADRSARDLTIPAPVEAPVETEVELEPEPEPAEDEEPGSVVEIVEAQRIVEVSPEEGGVSRRQFFNRAIAATFGTFLAAQGIYYLAFFWPKLTGGFGADIDAGPVSALRTQVFTAAGGILPVFIPEARAYLVPAPDTLSEQFEGASVATDGLMALYMRCVHLGCRVPWCAPSQGFECPCHGSRYNAIGEYFGGPAPRNLDRFVVENRGGNFVIRTGSIIETPRAPELSFQYPQGPSCISAVAASPEA
ncbi:MAG TPA: ubiquinol-cytochrome c reductase iron-sulfur subunit [Acidimicrobiia bacterium]|nr:ubiquinol-cytochrome c reductase iron-sulfur subunit [Acidimicrobiia bacterium]